MTTRRTALWGSVLGLALAFGVRDARAQEAEELLPTITGGTAGAEPGQFHCSTGDGRTAAF